jgi:hypothetical protein
VRACDAEPRLRLEHLAVPSYVEWVVTNVQNFEGVALAVTGETDDELAASLVDEMVRAASPTVGSRGPFGHRRCAGPRERSETGNQFSHIASIA